MAGKGIGAVTIAMLANGLLTVVKFIAFLLSGSGAMLSEAIHSLADTGNQGLLFLGIRRSERPADAMFHYGYGKERFLFALLAAVGLFVLGCGVTVYHGIAALFHPPELEIDWLLFAVLGFSFVVEGYVLLKASKAVASMRGNMPFLQFVRTSSDPTLLAVLFEDAVACVGVVIAALGIWLSYLTGSPVFDAISSILIGILMGLVAIWLAWRNRQLILGPAIPKEVEQGIIDLILAQPSVTSVHDIKSRVVAAERFLLKAEIDYDAPYLARLHLDWVRSEIPKLDDEASIKSFVEDFGERLLKSLADEIDRIEHEVGKTFPRLRHLDLESHVEEAGSTSRRPVSSLPRTPPPPRV